MMKNTFLGVFLAFALLLQTGVQQVNALTAAQAEGIINALNLSGSKASVIRAMVTTPSGGNSVSGDTVISGGGVFDTEDVDTGFANLSDCFSFSRNLSVGSSGKDVADLQTFLASKGFLNIPVGTTKGYFGGLTRAAVARYQASVGLTSEGFVGPMTRAKINSDCKTANTGNITIKEGAINCPVGFICRPTDEPKSPGVARPIGLSNVTADLISDSISVSDVSNSHRNGRAVAVLKFRVTAGDKDVTFPRTETFDVVAMNDEGKKESVMLATSYSGGMDSGKYILRAGETETFTLSALIEPRKTGYYSVSVNSIKWDGGSQDFTPEIETDTVYLVGSQPEGTPAVREIRNSIEVSQYSESKQQARAQFVIRVEAKDGNVEIEKKGAFNVKLDNNASFGNQPIVSYYADTRSPRDTSRVYVIQEGEVRTFTVDALVIPEVSGYYRVIVEEMEYNLEEMDLVLESEYVFLNVQVSAPAVELSPSSINKAVALGATVFDQITFSKLENVNASAGFSWKVVSGSLPVGLTISSNGNLFGKITGTTTRAGSYSATIRATHTLDSNIYKDMKVSYRVIAPTVSPSASPSPTSTGATSYNASGDDGTALLINALHKYVDQFSR